MSKELTVRNLYGIRGTITHKTDANVLVVTGENGAGKSSFVDAFGHIFAHKAIKNAPNPIHDGQLEAEASFTDDDGLTYTRRWKNGKMAALEIRADDGARYSQPGEILASKLGTITVDVSQFLAVDEKTRRDAILAKSRFPDGFDLNALTRDQHAAESRRTDANREVKRLEGALSQLTPPAKGTPDAEMSAAGLIQELDEARQENRLVEDTTRSAAALKLQIEETRKLLAEYEAKLERATVYLNNHAEVDTTELEEKLANVEDINRAVREKQQYEAAKAAYEAAKAEAEREEAAVKLAKSAKFTALKDAEFPHPSLSVDDEFVLVDGVAWPYVNSAEKSLVALATAISGEHEEGTLKLVILKEGDWLDAKSLAKAHEMLTEKGFFGLVDRGRPDLPSGVGIDVLEVADGQQV